MLETVAVWLTLPRNKRNLMILTLMSLAKIVSNIGP